MSRSRAFTLIELLVVVAVLALLMAIVSPSLRRSVGMTRSAQSRSNLHQIGQGMYTFATSHRSILPGCWQGWFVGPQDWQKSWMGNETWPGVSYPGTLLPYIGDEGTARQVYRCPSLEASGWRDGVGSNGLFDYSMFMCFAGSRTTSLPIGADIRMIGPPIDLALRVPAPLVVEEDPAQHLNLLSVDPGHSNTDRMGTYQVGRSGNYAAVDGSAHSLRFQGVGPMSNEWFAQAPSGTYYCLNSWGLGKIGWGGWQQN